MELKIGIDVSNKQMLALDGSPLTLPPVTQGDTVTMVLQGMELLASGDYRRVPIAFSTIKAGIGFVDAAPREGWWKARVSGVDTPELPHNVSKPALEAALNALAPVSAAGGVKVVPSGAVNIYVVRWNNPEVTTPITVAAMSLLPRCFARVTTWDLDVGRVQMIKLFQRPVAFTDQFWLPMPPAVTATRVRGGTGSRNEVQRISVPTGAQGEFSMTWSGLTTAIVPVLQATSAAIARALNDLYDDGVERFRVTQPGARFFYVEFVGPLAKAAQSLMTITMESQPVIETPTGKIPLNGPAVEYLLDGAPEREVSLEIEIIQDGESGTPIQTPLLLVNDMIDDPMAIENDPAWLEELVDPVARADHDASQVIVGERNYISTVGDAVVSLYEITHNLGTLNVHVTVRENGGTNRRVPDNEYTCTILDQNRVRIAFADAPDENQFVAIISSAGPESYFLGHNHSTDEILRDGVTLTQILDNLSALGNPLDLWPAIPVSKLPAIIPWDRIGGSGTLPVERIPLVIPRLGTDGRLELSTIPLAVPRVDPATGELVYWGVNPETGATERRVILDAKGQLASTLIPNKDTPSGIEIAIADVEYAFPPERRPGEFRALARAVKQDTPVNISTVLSSGVLAPAADHGGKVLQWDGTVQEALAPSTKTRAERKFTRTTAAFVMSDGANWHAAENYGGTYYATAFNREIFDIPVSEQMLAAGTFFELSFTLSAQIMGARRGQYYLTLRAGLPVATASGMGGNLASVNFDVLVFERRIVLAEALTEHAFGYRVTRAANGNMSAEARNYLTWASANAPTAPEFVLRAELNRFDSEDATAAMNFAGFTGNNAIPVGQVRVSMKSAKAGISKL